MLTCALALLRQYWTDNGAYYSGGNWDEAGGGGASVNETAFRAVSAGLKELSIDAAVRTWQLDDWCATCPKIRSALAWWRAAD